MTVPDGRTVCDTEREDACLLVQYLLPNCCCSTWWCAYRGACISFRCCVMMCENEIDLISTLRNVTALHYSGRGYGAFLQGRHLPFGNIGFYVAAGISLRNILTTSRNKFIQFRKK